MILGEVLFLEDALIMHESSRLKTGTFYLQLVGVDCGGRMVEQN